MQRRLGDLIHNGIVTSDPSWFNNLQGDIAEYMTTIIRIGADEAEEFARQLILFCIDDDLVSQDQPTYGNQLGEGYRQNIEQALSMASHQLGR